MKLNKCWKTYNKIPYKIMNQTILQADRLTKRFGKLKAVDDVSFIIKKNQTVALLGGNGAGKTTTMAMLLGLVIPSSGNISAFGKNFETNRFQLLSKMNFSSPYVDLPHRLSVKENLYVYAMLYGVRDSKKRVEEISESLDLCDFLKRPVGKLSSGQKTRVALAKALINNPSLLLLDEPTASLDPDTADWVRVYLEKWREKHGSSILLASHNMAEVERLANHVIMLKNGRVVTTGSPQNLIKNYSRLTLEEVFIDIARETSSQEKRQ